MTQKNNWKAYKEVIDSHHIDCLYHFTDRENLESIIQNGGLYLWADCEEKGITIATNIMGCCLTKLTLT